MLICCCCCWFRWLNKRITMKTIITRNVFSWCRIACIFPIDTAKLHELSAPHTQHSPIQFQYQLFHPNHLFTFSPLSIQHWASTPAKSFDLSWAMVYTHTHTLTYDVDDQEMSQSNAFTHIRCFFWYNLLTAIWNVIVILYTHTHIHITCFLKPDCLSTINRCHTIDIDVNRTLLFRWENCWNFPKKKIK